MATRSERTSGDGAFDNAPGSDAPATDVGVPKRWYYLTIGFLAWATLYALFSLFVLSTITLSGAAFGELALFGLFTAVGPLTVCFYLDTRRVAAANRNPEVVDGSRVLGSWFRPLRLVAVLLALNYVVPLLAVVSWYLVSTRPKALRAPATVVPDGDEERGPVRDDAEREQGEDGHEADVRDENGGETQHGDDGETRDETDDGGQKRGEGRPSLPSKRYQRAKALKRTGSERATAGATHLASGEYAAATTAYGEAVDAYEEALGLVDGYDIDDSALRADLDGARAKRAEASRIQGSATADEYLTRAREVASQGDERYTAADLAGAIDGWERAIAVYDRGIDAVAEEDAGDLRRLRQELRAKVTETERERARRALTDAETTADEALARGRDALDEEDYVAARDAFERAVGALERAQTTAAENDVPADYLPGTTLAARRGIVDATLGALGASVGSHPPDSEVAARGQRTVLSRVERELDALEASAGDVFTDEQHDHVARLRERVVIEMLSGEVNGQLAEMERAERLYAEEKFFEAREVYRRVRATIQSLLETASVSTTEEVANELDRIVLACELNVETVRQAIYDGDSTEPLVTTAEIRQGGPLPEEPDTVVGKVLEQLPDYRRPRQLGGGGFADIWVVESDAGAAVVKIPRVSDYETIPESKIRRFVAEAENWRMVDSHPNVVDVLQFGEKPVPWLLLERCEGTLRARLDEGMDAAARLDVLVAVGDALGHANAKGIAHLDIKPENVLFGVDGVAKLGDWGLSKVMTEGTITGTGHSLLYAAPEQLDRTLGERDLRTDVYQYGVLAYELLTGEHPFEVGSRESVVPPSEVSEDVDVAVDAPLLRALAYDQRERYEQVVQVRDALTAALGVEA